MNLNRHRMASAETTLAAARGKTTTKLDGFGVKEFMAISVIEKSLLVEVRICQRVIWSDALRT